MNNITADFPAREMQIEMLSELLLREDLSRNSAVKLLLHGPPNTGKTAILLKLLELTGKFIVFVDCQGCYLPRLLFESILRQLCEKLDDEDECDDWIKFVNYFKKLSAIDTKFDFLILKNCSVLDDYIGALINLPRLLSKDGWNFRTVFIDQKTSVYQNSIGNHIARIFFPRYNKSELLEVLLVLRPHYPHETYKNCLKIFLSCEYHSHRDLLEMLQLTDVAFANYKKPIDDNKISENDYQALYKNLGRILKSESKNLLHVFPQSLLPHAEEYESMKISADLELPKKTKYLLVAAYIASFVSSKHDKRLFCRQSSKRKKSNKNPSGDCPENKIASLLGPRQFTLNRVLNIFSALTAQRNLLTASLLQQVSFLVELKMLVLIGNSDGNLDTPRYKCVADFDYVATVARSVDCELKTYLI